MRSNKLVKFYKFAKAEVVNAGYGDEYEWQLRRNFESITEREFLEEYAWVVLNCGFREEVVRQIFPFISLAFFDFTSANRIVKHGEECIQIALFSFANRKKLQAIVDGSSLVADLGFKTFIAQVREDRNFLQKLPFIGSVTQTHLLKNIGFSIAKNDRHLAKLSGVLGFTNAFELCSHLAADTGDSISAIDLVLWRFCAINTKKNKRWFWDIHIPHFTYRP